MAHNMKLWRFSVSVMLITFTLCICPYRLSMFSRHRSDYQGRWRDRGGGWDRGGRGHDGEWGRCGALCGDWWYGERRFHIPGQWHCDQFRWYLMYWISGIQIVCFLVVWDLDLWSFGAHVFCRKFVCSQSLCTFWPWFKRPLSMLFWVHFVIDCGCSDGGNWDFQCFLRFAVLLEKRSYRLSLTYDRDTPRFAFLFCVLLD